MTRFISLLCGLALPRPLSRGAEQEDRGKNRGRSVQALVDHMTGDALVQWAWSPGERTPPTIGQREFHDLVRQWARTGAPCPP